MQGSPGDSGRSGSDDVRFMDRIFVGWCFLDFLDCMI